MVRAISAIFLLFLLCSCAAAQAPTAQPTAPPPSNDALQSSAANLQPSASIEQILDALDARGHGLNDFSADVSLTEQDTLGGGGTTLIGKVWYQAKGEGDARLRVRFDQKKIGSRTDNNSRVEYLLDKGWLVDRDYRRQIEVDRQVLKPGQKINLLKLGEGPFPLPIGQPREQVLKLFDVKKIEPKQGDPQNTVHIQLIPKPDTRFARKFSSIEVWVDLTTHFPVRIETADRNGTESRTTDLSNIKVNQGLTDQQFALEPVQGWTVRREEMTED